MTWQQEFWSWMSPAYVKTAEPPAVGQKAPSTPKLVVPQNGKPTIIAFLRHCGCPCRFSERNLDQAHLANHQQSQRRLSSICATQPLPTLTSSSSPSHIATRLRQTIGSPPCPIPPRIPNPTFKSLSMPNEKRTQRTVSVYQASTMCCPQPD